MDYKKHHDLIIERARDRKLEDYKEVHHITPRCMGGDNSKENLVELTPEEHYVIHQLLVKMYPNSDSLIFALGGMISNSPTQNRNNKEYGWVKRKYIEACRNRNGSKNSSYGKSWYYNPITQENKKFYPGQEPEGWVKGRKSPRKNIKIWYTNTQNGQRDKFYPGYEPENWIKGYFPTCLMCNKVIDKNRKYCDKHSKENRDIITKTLKQNYGNFYQELWDFYKNSSYNNIKEFANSNDCPVNERALRYGWKNYIDEFNNEHLYSHHSVTKDEFNDIIGKIKSCRYNTIKEIVNESYPNVDNDKLASRIRKHFPDYRRYLKKDTQEKYQELWDFYINSNYNNIKEFAISNECPVKEASLREGFKKYVQ